MDPASGRTLYSFPIHAGDKFFRFQINLDKASRVTGVTVFRPRETTPFQSLSACKSDFTDEFDENVEKVELLEHADLNFDGFEDLKVLENYFPHLSKKLFCIYLWDQKLGHFRFAPQLTNDLGNPVPHPDSKTLTVHEDWMGGAFEDSSYRWEGAKLELIEKSGLYGDWSQQTEKQCGFDFNCNRLLDGKMVPTLDKPICNEEEMEHLPACPAASTPTRPKSANSN